MLFSLDSANNIIFLSCFFFFFLIIHLCLLVNGAIAQILNPIAELAIPIGIPSKETKGEIEIHPVTTEAKIRKSLI